MLPLTPIPNSNLSSKDEVSEGEMPPDERKIGALEESLISFRLSGPNERLSQHDQLDEEPTSSAESLVQSPRRKLRRRSRTKKREGRRCRSTAQKGKSRIDANLTPRRARTGLRERSLRRPGRPQCYRLREHVAGSALGQVATSSGLC